MVAGSERGVVHRGRHSTRRCPETPFHPRAPPSNVPAVSPLENAQTETPPLTPPARRALFARLGFAAAALVVFSFAARLALQRHIHVDEFHNVYSMQLMGVFGHPEYADPVEVYHVVFSFLTRHFSSTRAMFEVLRVLYAGLFVVLLALIARWQPFFTSPVGRLAVFVGMAGWWPGWRHGFEIRHDLLLALGVAALYTIAVRGSTSTSGVSPRAAVTAGFVAALMQLNSHKAVTLWGPGLLTLAVLAAVSSPGRRTVATARLVGFEALGAAVGVAAGAALFSTCGALPAYVDRLVHFAEYASAADPFPALPLYREILDDGTPGSLLAALFAVALVVALLRRNRRIPRVHVVTGAFLLAAVVALAVNPVPFPYNVVWMTPALAFAAVGGARLLVDAVARLHPRAPVLAGAVVLGTTLWQTTLVANSDRWMRATWRRQLEIIEAAEALTAPDEPILDGVGMVCTRPPPSADWLIHSVFMREYERGAREQVRDIVARAAPPVVIRGHYRFNWLPPADRELVDEHYVALSDQLWVLGARVRGPGARISVARAGRYLVRPPEELGPAGPAAGPILVDGTPIPANGIVSLAAGRHRVEAPVGALVAWLGPHLDELPRVDSTRYLFGKPRMKGQ